jgi:hypothetical protein
VGEGNRAGDVQGHAIITKRLTKKALSPVVYNLRGAVPGPPTPTQTEPESEFDRLVVVLEGGAPHAKPPETVVIEQRNMRFDPDLVVIPTGSTVVGLFEIPTALSHLTTEDEDSGGEDGEPWLVRKRFRARIGARWLTLNSLCISQCSLGVLPC